MIKRRLGRREEQHTINQSHSTSGGGPIRNSHGQRLGNQAFGRRAIERKRRRRDLSVRSEGRPAVAPPPERIVRLVPTPRRPPAVRAEAAVHAEAVRWATRHGDGAVAGVGAPGALAVTVVIGVGGPRQREHGRRVGRARRVHRAEGLAEAGQGRPSRRRRSAGLGQAARERRHGCGGAEVVRPRPRRDGGFLFVH